ncbi:MAG: hypothetical protein P9M14_11920 [Candidatus Alcyoniella australis]|nr:hypothetical protein [Candidatus Alcyoniella australis]
MPNDATNWFEIFKLGKYPQGDWSDPSKIDGVIARYDASVHEAPLILGHSQDDQSEQPSYGWVTALKRVGDRVLAQAKQVPQVFREAVEGGRFPKRSVEIWRDLDGGGPYLRAIAFLGATTPQIKGLTPVKFGDGGKFDVFELEAEGGFDSFEQENQPGSGGAPDAQGNGAPPKNTEEQMDLQAQLDALQKQMAELQAGKESEAAKFAEDAKKQAEALKAKDGELAKLKAQGHRSALESYFDKLAAEGKAAPAWKDAGIVAFMEQLESEAGDEVAVLNFSDEKKEITPLTWFQEFLGALPEVVDFKEIATKTKAQPETEMSKFNAQGGNLDAERAELDATVEQYRSEHPDKSYGEALEIVTQQAR